MVTLVIRTKKRMLSIGLIFFISILLLHALCPFFSPLFIFKSNPSSSIVPLKPTNLSPTYTVRAPISYQLEGQPIVVFGHLDHLVQEASVLSFHRDFEGVSTGMTYAIFTFSTSGLELDQRSILNLNWEVHGMAANIDTASANYTSITAFIEHQNSSWIPIYSITSPTAKIPFPYGWNQYRIPTPLEQHLQGDQIRVRFNLANQLISNASWTQRLYIYWLVLEFQKDVARIRVNASRFELLTPGFTASGDLDDLSAEDGEGIFFERVTNPEGESGTMQFIVEYDLGYYGLEELLGLRFSHYDWVDVNGIGSFSYEGVISIVGDEFNAYLCHIRDKTTWAVTPNVQHGTYIAIGNCGVNQCIRLLFSIQYRFDNGPFTFRVHADWCSLSIIRSAAPLVVLHQLSNTLYVDEVVQLNVTCLEGKVPISEVRLAPWDALLGVSQGNYMYSRVIEESGEFNLFITIQDEDFDSFTFSIGTVRVVQNPLNSYFYTIIVAMIIIVLVITVWLKRKNSNGKVRQVMTSIKRDLKHFK